MKVHIIIDFMHVYYKYFFMLRDGRIKRLSAAMEVNGVMMEKDTSLIYYPLRDIEEVRRKYEAAGHEVTMSICFDMPSTRSDDESEYKSTRVSRLSDDDFLNINTIKELLEKAGHNVYRYEGYEADDIVNYLVRAYSNDFDYNIIYTNDKDLLVNIQDKVGVMRHKTGKGYEAVDKNNYTSYLESEFGVFIPYNALGLFLASAGDSADHIKGITKFGPKAFSKLITKVAAKYPIDWTECGDYTKLEQVVLKCEEFLKPEQFEELKKSFALVANLELFDEVPKPDKISTAIQRKEAYEPHQMVHLI